ncbi:MAG: response regulator transcription factor [Nitrospira sp.]
MTGEMKALLRRQRNTRPRIDRGVHPRSIRLLIAETQRLIRQSLRLLLEREQDVASVIEATDGHEAYRLALEHKPDIALLDVDMPDLDVESVAKRIYHHLPNTRILLLARYDEDSRIVGAMQAGAFGYILKDTDWTDFLCIIRAAAHGEQAVSPMMPDRVVQAVPGAVKHPYAERGILISSLTEREQEILACAAAGRSNKEMADQLCVSVETVKTHLHHIYQKLSVSGRVEAILTYLRAQ